MSKMHSRRLFLQRSLALMSAGVTVPTFIDSTAWAMADPLDTKNTQQTSGSDNTILVVVQMSGGNDGLSSVIPYADDAYQKARPTLAKSAKDVLKINDYIGLNPNLADLKNMYDDGMLSIVQGVGYPNPNRSHFRSMDIWHTAEPDKETVATGWLGRYFDNTCVGTDPHAGVSIGDVAPLAMKGARISPLAFERPDNYRYKGKDVDRYKQLNSADEKTEDGLDPQHAAEHAARTRAMKAAASRRPQIITPGSQLEFLTRTSMDAQASSNKILDLVNKYQTASAYPRNGFGDGLKTIAAMIRGGLPTRVYYVSLGGFDTHAGQLGRHDNLMKDLSAGVGAFWADMKEQKNTQRVAVMCFSEFGRRVEQNGSAGTDHGAAAPLFLIGGGISKMAGVVGAHPSLTKLDSGDLMYNIDFRSVYATLLEGWLKTPSKPVLGQQFRTMPMFRT